MSGKPRNAGGEAANGATIQTINPARHEPGRTYRLHTLDEARSIAVNCAAAQKLWRRTALAERSKLMHAAARIMRANKSRYAALMTEEMGKTITEGLAEIEKCAATAEYFAPIERTCWDLGFAVSPDDAWLGSRGLRTMAVRLKQHEASALKIAHWLQEQPQVERVLHPALPDCPGHAFWKRDFSGSSGLFSFLLRSRDDARRVAFIERLEQFAIGYSWGGFESLVAAYDPVRTVSKAPPVGSLVRLQIGLEDANDLIADLAQALTVFD